MKRTTHGMPFVTHQIAEPLMGKLMTYLKHSEAGQVACYHSQLDTPSPLPSHTNDECYILLAGGGAVLIYKQSSLPETQRNGRCSDKLLEDY